MAKNPMFQGRTKHIELRYHLIRDKVISGTIEVKFCQTKDQITNGLPKALNYASFINFLGDLSVSSFA